MTKEELDKMTPEEKRVRIAEICGWTRRLSVPPEEMHGVRNWGLENEERFGIPCWEDPSGKYHASLPDFINDLNAMAEAENLHFTKPENAGLANAYRGWLVNMNWEGSKGFDYSASERADAFLLTLG